MLAALEHVNLTQFIITAGYFGLILIIFMESGVFFGFFLPGDSLLFVSGVLASQGHFNIYVLIITLLSAAFLGYAFGYWFGFRLEHWLMSRRDSIWFQKRYIEKAKVFYEKWGGETLILGRFVPIVRTFIPIVAGMAEMRLPKFFLYNLIGGLVWATGLPLLGYFLGDLIPDAGKYIVPVILIIVLLSFLPGLFHYLKKRKSA